MFSVPCVLLVYWKLKPAVKKETTTTCRFNVLLQFILMSDLKSTGRVVGILQRNWRDYVVTFPPRDATQSQSRNSQRILAIPWDRRIPKIRISTQQADALQVWIALKFMYSMNIIDTT